MTGFTYRNGVLCADSVSLSVLADQIGTPFYVYSETRLRENYAAFYEPLKDLNPLIAYAVKANPNLAVLRVLAACGAGADATGAGEIERAAEAGIDPRKIIFSGVGKTREEIAAALKLGVLQFNCESLPEIEALSAVAQSLNLVAPIALRVNPNIAARTHYKLATGEMGVKFGIDAVQLPDAMALIRRLPALAFKGFQVHVGTHLFDYGNFRDSYAKLAEMVRFWRGEGFSIERLDLGGGVGIPYDGQTQAPFAEYAAIVHETVGDLGCELAFEPGRRLVGDAGVLVSRVVYDKRGASKRFLILDAGMNDLIRPAMYEARHGILPVKESAAEAEAADVVGPICETSDLFGEAYLLPGVDQGDLVAIQQGGAYASAMSSNYNGRALVPEILVSEDTFRIVRRRISVREQMGWEEA